MATQIELPAVDESKPAEPGLYPPPPELVAQAADHDLDGATRQAQEDLAGFWAERAAELEWYAPWTTVLDESRAPFYKWFVGAKVNIVHNALDRHVKTRRKNKQALIWEGEDGAQRIYTYFSLWQEVNKLANVLKAMGVRKGDRVTIYLGRIPELPLAMLACAKIGAIHNVVYSGFSVETLHSRIMDSESRVLITCDGAYANGQILELKKIADAALQRSPTVEIVLVVKRTGRAVNMEPGRDLWLHELMNLPIAATQCVTEVMDAEDPLFLLYTSGTTGTPKAILHTHGGYMVGVATTLQWIFDVKDNDRWWCTEDPGGITGHSYGVYGPLVCGATGYIYEGTPLYPYPNRWWSLIERHGITILYTSPTALRRLMYYSEAWPNRHDLRSLRMLGTTGEPISPETWRWFHRVIGGGRCPVIDTWWQTETGMVMIAPLPSDPLQPGSTGMPFPGVTAEVLDERGNLVAPGAEGYLVLTRPWPAMFRTIYKHPEAYVQAYWKKYPGKYLTGDFARRDEDGTFRILGRVDEVIKVSGIRLGTAEIESALLSHRAVAEAAVVGLPHAYKGQTIQVFVVLRQGWEASASLAEELRQHVTRELGLVAIPEKIAFLTQLPRTGSGKIMRRVLRARALGLPEGDVSTLAE
ncbi:MAG: acetate--CoA ligase [Chloroflexi bacterium]|nr:acetate--CoA ligase [Chloroflexota bacterium]